MATTATPWVEKYRPKSLTDVSHQTEVISTLQNAVRTNRLPHLLFYGPPGTGKTSVALALCRTLWHPSQLQRRVLELNASDERGISVVRDKIKHFAGLAVGTSSFGGSSSSGAGGSRNSFFRAKGSNGSNNKETKSGEEREKKSLEEEKEKEMAKYPNPPFKIIILDEADTVTPDAQAALRRVIEAHSKITRFILICNYVTRIIEPLASRCAKFRFQSLPPSSMKNRLTTIAHAEHCRFSINDNDEEEKEREVMDEILHLSQGDMRRAVTTLQSAHCLSRVGGVGTKSTDADTSSGHYIRKESIAEMAGLPPAATIQTLLDALQNSSTSFDDMEVLVQDIAMEGYATQHVLSALLKELIVLEKEQLSEIHKSEIAIKIAEVDKNLIDGADEMLQLLVVCSLILRCFKSGAGDDDS